MRILNILFPVFPEPEHGGPSTTIILEGPQKKPSWQANCTPPAAAAAAEGDRRPSAGAALAFDLPHDGDRKRIYIMRWKYYLYMHLYL